MRELALTVAGETIENPGLPALSGDGISGLSDILSVGIELLFILSILLCLFFIIWGGCDWMTAGGNKENIQKARQKIIWAVAGLFVVFLSFLVINVLSQFFGINFYIIPGYTWDTNPMNCPPGGWGCIKR